MNRLLRDALFDGFEVRAVEMVTLTRLDISGAIENKPDGEEPSARKYVEWARLKPLITAIIKSSQMPGYLKAVFSCGAEETQSIHPNASALFLNMIYENGAVRFTAASAQKQFSMDKSVDERWEEYVRGFFTGNAIKITEEK
ncbi:MAG: DUF5721 family protein [Clostridiales bacterium]|nr:DUF5721 family protein [Clostridiales bacterium]